MRPKALPRVIVVAEEVFVMIVAEIAAVPIGARAGEALHPKMIVGFRGKATCTGHTFQQALRERDRGWDTKLVHLPPRGGAVVFDIGSTQDIDFGSSEVRSVRKACRSRADRGIVRISSFATGMYQLEP